MAKRLPPLEQGQQPRQEAPPQRPARAEDEGGGFFDSMLHGATAGMAGDTSGSLEDFVGGTLGSAGLIAAARKAAQFLPGKYGKWAKLLAPAAVGLASAAGEEGDLTTGQALMGAGSGLAGGTLRTVGPALGVANTAAKAMGNMAPRALQRGAAVMGALGDKAVQGVTTAGNIAANAAGGAAINMTTSGRGRPERPQATAPDATSAAEMQKQAISDPQMRQQMIDNDPSKPSEQDDGPTEAESREMEMLRKLREGGMMW